MPKIIADGADITEHVQSMFDALVGSLDWGSGFLDDETIHSILLVGRVLGVEIPDDAKCKSRDATLPFKEEGEDWNNFQERRMAALRWWKAQETARIDAELKALRGEV